MISVLDLVARQALCAGMIGPGSVMDPAHRAEAYRNKAEEISIEAEKLRNAETRQILLDIAADYLQMAQTLERLATMRLPQEDS